MESQAGAEAVRLRVKDADLRMKRVTVRSGKGDKDRFTDPLTGVVREIDATAFRVEWSPWNPNPG